MSDEFVPRSLEELAVAWPAELAHISATSLKMFMRCPEQWRRRYALGEKAAPGAAMIQGRADHKAIGFNFAKKLETGEDLPVEDVRGAFASEFDSEVDLAGGPSQIDWGGTDNPRKAAAIVKDNGVRLVSLYREQQAPLVWPTEVEPRFELELPHLPVKLIGYLDLVAEQFEPFSQQPVAGTEAIIERKTAGSAKVQEETRFQARTYQMFKPLPVEIHISVKRNCTLAFDAVAYEQRRAEKMGELALRLVRQIGFFYASLGPEEAWPGALTHPWACSYCGWRSSCHWQT